MPMAPASQSQNEDAGFSGDGDGYGDMEVIYNPHDAFFLFFPIFSRVVHCVPLVCYPIVEHRLQLLITC